jgi:hypothetical protein
MAVFRENTVQERACGFLNVLFKFHNQWFNS